MEDIFKQALGDIAGGRVLDVATGRGDFIDTLETFASHTEIVAIDIIERFLRDARDSYAKESVYFIGMDAERLAFSDESFDVVCAAKSVHHWVSVPQVLNEMKRVLKPGGRLGISDFYRDAQTEAQLTVVSIHHWAAKVSTFHGLTHNETFTRQELVDFVQDLGLSNIALYDWSDTDSDPMDAESVGERQELIDRVLQHAQDMPNYPEMARRGEQLRQRLHAVGVQSEPVLVMIGEK